MQFARPENLWMLLLLVPMLGVYVGYWVWKQRKMKSVGHHPLVEAMARSRSPRLQVARAALVILSVALLIIASARPQWGQINRPIKRMGVDVVFALDLSRSMLARDATPNRLQAAKDEIETTMQLLSGDRVGLVVFTSVSFAQSPLTTDYGAIRFYLDKLDPEQMPMGGTSVGRAMLDAIELLEAHAEEASAAENRVIVLITDGEDHESDPLGAAHAAREKGIHVVTVGLGSSEGERIPILNPDGSIAGFKRDREGNIVRTRLDSNSLERIAQTTGGRYIHFTGKNSVANGVVSYVNELEKTELETLMRERYEDRFAWFVGPALLLLLLSAGLGDRRRRKKQAAIATALVAAFTLWGCDRPFEQPQDEVAAANELVERGEFQKALELYEEAQKQHPTTPELSYNKGRALLGLERFEEAQQAFAKGLESVDPQLRFDSQANLGLALAGQEEWAEAYEAFRAALRIAGQHPSKIDNARIEQTRRDLETAFRKLFPPCSKLEDAREQDDTPKQAKQLENGEGKELTLCGNDDDWVLVPAIAGTTVSVTAKFKDLREEPDPEQIFAKRASDIQVALVSGDGETILAIDQGDPKTFDSNRRHATRTIEKFQITPSMLSDSEGIFVKLKAADALEFQYDLNIKSIPPCHALQESSEPNNELGAAAPIPADPQQPLQAHICGADEDWHSFEVEMGDALFFDVVPSMDEETGVMPELEIELLDSNGNKLADGIAEAGLYTVGSRIFREAGTVHLRVRGAKPDTQGPYSITTYHYLPCIVGDDRYEENDDASNAFELDPAAPIHRYLRICEADPDFFRLPFSEAQQDDASGSDSDAGTPPPTGEVKMGLARISLAEASMASDAGQFTLDLMSQTGDQILAEGLAPGPTAPTTGEAPPMPLERILLAPEVEGDSAIIRVTGPADFYHLVQLNPQQPPQEQEQEQQEQDEQEQDQGDEGEEESEEQQDGSEGDEDESSEDESEGDGADEEKGEEDQKESGQGEDEKKPEDGEEQKAEKKKASPGEEDAESPDRKRMEAILDALEQSDDNFQMKKALEDVPGRFIEKDW